MAGMLGGTPQRDRVEKPRLFNAFVRSELCEAIDASPLSAGSWVFDAGCGPGEAAARFHASTRGSALVVGVDLATAHVRAARRTALAGAPVLQADMTQPPLADVSFDLVRAVNAINRLRDPVAGVRVPSGHRRHRCMRTSRPCRRLPRWADAHAQVHTERTRGPG
jgi:SAM-dependent methyltransferase